MNFETLRSNYKQQILAIAGMYGVSDIRVFGSVASGNAKANSDVDFLVTANPGTSLLKLAGFQNNLEDLLHCKVDVVTDGKRFASAVFEQIKNSAEPL
jgi:predicted nucleotidyltransferase